MDPSFNPVQNLLKRVKNAQKTTKSAPLAHRLSCGTPHLSSKPSSGIREFKIPHAHRPNRRVSRVIARANQQPTAAGKLCARKLRTEISSVHDLNLRPQKKIARAGVRPARSELNYFSFPVQSTDPPSSRNVEAIGIHHLRPRSHEVLHKRSLRVVARIHFSDCPQLRV